jgi:hypothetical protein
MEMEQMIARRLDKMKAIQEKSDANLKKTTVRLEAKI